MPRSLLAVYPERSTPLVVVNKGELLRNNFEIKFGKDDTRKIISTIKGFPDGEWSIQTNEKTRRFKTIIPKDGIQYLLFLLENNIECQVTVLSKGDMPA